MITYDAVKRGYEAAQAAQAAARAEHDARIADLAEQRARRAVLAAELEAVDTRIRMLTGGDGRGRGEIDRAFERLVAADLLVADLSGVIIRIHSKEGWQPWVLVTNGPKMAKLRKAGRHERRILPAEAEGIHPDDRILIRCLG